VRDNFHVVDILLLVRDTSARPTEGKFGRRVVGVESLGLSLAHRLDARKGWRQPRQRSRPPWSLERSSGERCTLCRGFQRCRLDETDFLRSLGNAPLIIP